MRSSDTSRPRLSLNAEALSAGRVLDGVGAMYAHAVAPSSAAVSKERMAASAVLAGVLASAVLAGVLASVVPFQTSSFLGWRL